MNHIQPPDKEFDQLLPGERINMNELMGSQHFNQEIWRPRYGEYSRELIQSKITTLAAVLIEQGFDAEQIQQDAADSNEFIERCMAEYENPRQSRDEGSFGFVVPTRVRRSINGQSDGYLDEWLQLYPLLQHVNSDVGQRFLTGTPPMIVDQYAGLDAEGRRGYMLFAPFYYDMTKDFGEDLWGLAVASQKIFKDTGAFAKRLGISTVGYGATLPKTKFLLNKVGLDTETEGVESTTGHTGTILLISKTLERLKKNGLMSEEASIGIVGAGSIGVGYATYERAISGNKHEINACDRNLQRLEDIRQSDLDLNILTSDTAELIRNSDVIVCAAIVPISLAELGITDLEGKTIVDDSQPGCFDPDEVQAAGGNLVWVIGQDPTQNGEITRENFNYSGWGPAAQDEIWGCELEAFVIHRFPELSGVRGEVSPADVIKLAPYLDQLEVAPAPFQARGMYLGQRLIELAQQT